MNSRCNDTGLAFAPSLVVTAQEIDEILEITQAAVNEVLGSEAEIVRAGCLERNGC